VGRKIPRCVGFFVGMWRGLDLTENVCYLWRADKDKGDGPIYVDLEELRFDLK
jgi:hypothetical protein